MRKLTVLLLVLFLAVPVFATRRIEKNSTDIITYFVLRNLTDSKVKTDKDVTELDLYYVRDGATMAAKVDCGNLGAADAAWDDNEGYHVGQGVYRIDWPNAAFATGVSAVQLIVTDPSTDVFVEVMEVELVDNVNKDIYDRIGAPVGASISADVAAVAGDVWDELSTGHTGAGKAGEQLWTNVDAVLADTGELQGDWVNDGRLDLILDEIFDTVYYGGY